MADLKMVTTRITKETEGILKEIILLRAKKINYEEKPVVYMIFNEALEMLYKKERDDGNAFNVFLKVVRDCRIVMNPKIKTRILNNISTMQEYIPHNIIEDFIGLEDPKVIFHKDIFDDNCVFLNQISLFGASEIINTLYKIFSLNGDNKLHILLMFSFFTNNARLKKVLIGNSTIRENIKTSIGVHNAK